MSANEISATAHPPINAGTMSARVIQGMAKPGKPCESEPRTDTPARVARSRTPTATVAPTTAIRMPGSRGHRLCSRITASVSPPTMKVVQLICPSISAEAMAPMFLNGPSDSMEKPNSLGNWLINTVSAMPFM